MSISINNTRGLPAEPGLIEPLLIALGQYDTLTAAEQDLIRALPARSSTYQKESQIVRQGDRPDHSCILLEGMAARALMFADGRRQITNVHIPGDFVDLHSLFLKRLDHTVLAFTDCKVLFIPHADLKQLLDHNPHLMHLFWLTTLVDAAIDRAWIACLGRRPAGDHLAHFLCELYTRLRGRGLVNGNSFAFGATQEEFADVLGMSTVHVNRTVQTLRKLGLITWESGQMTLLDLDELAEHAEFDPAYLNQWIERR
jgi:CRP-like cAMP-binding protein